jgi:predicted TIM-barrel fold metal-dependent hydrolase
MAAIDIHAHAFPDDLAKRAMKALEESADWKAALDGKVKSLLGSMDKADIDVSVVCPIATKPGQVEGILKWCAEIRSDRLDAFPSVHPKDADPASWLRRIAEAGFSGIKLHPMYQDFSADDAGMLELYAAAGELGLTVLIHCGRDVAFPMDDDRAEPARIAQALGTVQTVDFVATHLGGWRMWEESRRHLVGARCYMETSFSLYELPADEALRMIRAHGVDKVLFGTDSPWADQKLELERVRALGLTEQELKKILFGNAARILGL